LARDAIGNLLDRELDDAIRDRIEQLVRGFGFTKGLHDLRTRDLGGTYTFEFHLELDGGLSLATAHGYAHEVESAILKRYPNAQVIIHEEPVGCKEDHLDDKITA